MMSWDKCNNCTFVELLRASRVNKIICLITNEEFDITECIRDKEKGRGEQYGTR